MIPVVTPTEVAAVDRAASEPVEVLIGRAGGAVARAAVERLGRARPGGPAGARVVVVAGRGNNGADGRAAAEVLRARGARVDVLEATAVGAGERLPRADLVIDAAYGTGLRRPYHRPDPGPAPVLAVDIPSGLDGITGTPLDGGDAVEAVVTVTFAALKPGLLLGAGPDHTGTVVVADIGLGDLVAAATRAWVVEDADVTARLPRRDRQAHKWQAAVQVVAGSPAMPGAALLVARGALRAGAGYVLVSVPGAGPGGGLPPGEQVARPVPAHDWGAAAAESAGRAGAAVVGPGLGDLARGPDGRTGPGTPVAAMLAAAAVPVVVDADGLGALGSVDDAAAVLAGRGAPTVLTPHAGEYRRLTGHPPGPDRIADVRATAARTGAVVLLKGAPTIVAGPDGAVLMVTSGSARLATAGSGDVLSGMIGAFLARGLPALEAAALAAHAHGRAAGRGRAEGLVASDLPDLVSGWLSAVVERGVEPGAAP